MGMLARRMVGALRPEQVTVQRGGTTFQQTVWKRVETAPIERKSIEGKRRPAAGAGAQLSEAVRERLKVLGVSKLPAAHIAEVQVDERRLVDPDQAHTGALLRWKDESGKEQRSYSAEFDRRNAEKKWARVIASRPKVEAAIGEMRERAASSPAHAAALLMAETALRPGNPESAEKHGHFGVTTMQARHVSFDGDRAHIEFVGKAGKTNRTAVDDPALVRALRANVEGREPTDRVFAVPKEAVGKAVPRGVKLKDLRTIAATTHAENRLAANAPKLSGDAKKDARQVVGILKAVSREVAGKLNNTPAIARRAYIAPQVIRAWGEQHGIPEEWLR